MGHSRGSSASRRIARENTWGVFALVLLTVASGCGVGTPRVRPMSTSYDECEDPAAAEAYAQAREAREAGDLATATEHFREVVELCPDFVLAHVSYQDAARGARDADAVAGMLAFYEELSDRPASPVVPYVKSRVARDDADKLPLLDLAITRDGSFYPALLDKAQILRRLDRRTSEALDALQRAVSARPSEPEARLELAETLGGLGRSAEARAHYEAYLATAPDDIETLRDYIRLLIYDLGDLDRADELNAGLMARDEEDAFAWMDHAAIAWRRGELDDARDAYLNVLRIDPEQDRAALNLGNLHFDAFAGDSDVGRRVHWPKARAAYRYFLGLQRAEGVADLIDAHFGVPYRLHQIENLLGPVENDALPRLDEL